MVGDHFSTAVKFGHQAFRFLGYVFQDLNGKQFHSMPPEEFTRVCKNIVLHYIIAASNFQFMMEAIINNFTAVNKFSPAIQLGNDFKKMWQMAFKEKNIQDQNALKTFFQEFYEGIRLEIIHPRHIERFRLPSFRFKRIYLGFRAGWRAYEQLSEAVGRKHDDNSWDIVCRVNDLPPDIDEATLDQIDDILNAQKYHYEEAILNFIEVSRGSLQILANVYAAHKQADALDTDNPMQAFFSGAQVMQMGENEFYNCLQATVLFHAMIESVVNFLCDKFALRKVEHTDEKLGLLFNCLGLDDGSAGHQALLAYIQFYQKYRHGFLHPISGRSYLEFEGEYNIFIVYRGFQNGWKSITYLVDRLIELRDRNLRLPDIPSWNELTIAVGLPQIITEIPPRSMRYLAGCLFNRHLSVLNQHLVAERQQQITAADREDSPVAGSAPKLS